MKPEREKNQHSNIGEPAKAKANLIITSVIMTVAGQKNHYNVKLLKGYGISINLKGNRVCLKGGSDPFTGEQEIEEWFVTQIPY